MATALITTSFQANGVTTSNTMTVSEDGYHEVAFSLTSSQANKQYAVSFAFARLRAIQVTTTKDITIKTNSSSEPDDEIDVNGGEGLDWNALLPSNAANPFDANVATIYITNDEASACTGLIRWIEDGTP